MSTSDELRKVIEETILEMLKEEDEELVALMMTFEKNMDGESMPVEDFINEAIDRMNDRLGIIVESEDRVETGDLQKMRALVEFLDGEKE